MKKIILAVLLIVILCGCGNSNYDISSNRHKGKLQTFMDYDLYADVVIDQLIEIINARDAQKLSDCFTKEKSEENITKCNAGEILDFIEGEVLDYERVTDRIRKSNGGLFSNHYAIFFVRVYDIKTTQNEYRICYNYCYCNGDPDKEGMVSLGVSTLEDYDKGAVLYYGIPGLYISTCDNANDIEEIKTNYGEKFDNGELVPLEN